MLLQLENIKFSFPGKRQLLDNISFNLEKEKIYALMGTNGSGKTTLFNLISGFLTPQSGNILFNEKSITKLPPYKINQLGIGRTFQDLRLITKLNVKENVLLASKGDPTNNWAKALMPANVYKKKSIALSEQADKILTEHFLDDVKYSLAGQISYGQQKLLTLACCVANDSECLLIDEPVAGIQPKFQQEIGILIKKLKERGKAIFFIDHNTDFIAELADEIFFLHEGKISAFESISSLRADKAVMEAYL